MPGLVYNVHYSVIYYVIAPPLPILFITLYRLYYYVIYKCVLYTNLALQTFTRKISPRLPLRNYSRLCYGVTTMTHKSPPSSLNAYYTNQY